MIFTRLAELVVLVHAAFVLFVVAGGLLVLRWPRLAWLHLPAVLWAAWVEFSGWLCPLTPLENWLRRQGGGQPYDSGFMVNYLLPWLYPASLTRRVQVWLGILLLAVNIWIYLIILTRMRLGKAGPGRGSR